MANWLQYGNKLRIISKGFGKFRKEYTYKRLILSTIG